MIRSCLVLAPFFLFCSIVSSAQFSAGGGLSLNKYGGYYGKLHTAGQLRAGYEHKGRFFLSGGINLSPTKSTKHYSAWAYSNTGAQEVSIVQTVTINNAFLHLGYIFGAQAHRFRFKAFAGASQDMVSRTYSMSGTDPGYVVNGYSNDRNKTKKIDIGFGGDYKLGHGKLFLELVGGIPLGTIRDGDRESPEVSHAGMSLGYQYYFDGQKKAKKKKKPGRR